MNYKTTFILPHSGAVNAITNGVFSVFEMGCEFPFAGNKQFKNEYPWHSLGIVFNYSSLSNPEILGSSYALLPYIKMNVLHSKKSKWTGRIGAGIAYIEKPFDPTTNFKNFVIGSYINNITDLQLTYNQIFNNSELNLGFGLQHFSNGSIKRPNLGINLPYINIGYKFNNASPQYKPNRDTSKVKNSFFVNTSYGFKNIEHGTTDKFSVWQMGLGYKMNFKRNKSLQLQLDVIHDWSVPYLKEYTYTIQAIDNWIIGGFLWYEKRFGNIGLLAGSGYYLHSVYKTFNQDWNFANKGGRFYNRTAVKYYFEKLYAQIAIRAHMGEADNFEFGIGYQL